LDGKIIACDRCNEPAVRVKGEVIDLWYSGKAHAHGGNIQAVTTPDGFPLRASEAEAPVIVIVRRPVVLAGGGRATAIGIQHDEPQLVIVSLGAAPGPVPSEGIGVAWPTGLILTAQPDMNGELEPGRVGADTADGYGHPLSADQHHLRRDRPGDHTSERIQPRRRR
jgi:hypothetical protein